MSSTIGKTSATALRLASAQRRVRAFLNQIDQLESSDFPHPDGRDALAYIKNHFEIREKSLTALPEGVSDAVVDEMCSNTSVNLARNTEVLGFILRSTNVRNAFEVHFPLKRLVKQVVSDSARLVMSSEWNFVPFTYPMTLNLLPNFVLVGGPAPESGNVLIIPLAGHEIGHSAWRAHQVKEAVQAEATKAVDAALAANPTGRDHVVAELEATGYTLSYLQNACLFSVMRQLEEVFCDLFGLYVFGEAYVYAYDYFLAPGGGARSSAYPEATDRLRYLLGSAEGLGIDVKPEMFGVWQKSVSREGVEADVLKFADVAVEAMVPMVQAAAFDLLKARGVNLNRPEVIERVVKAFANHVPDGEGATLAEIISAGWRYLRAQGGLARADEREEHDMLNALMLKSIEVSEFLLRVQSDAERS